MKGKTRARAIRAQIWLIEALITAEQIRAPAGAVYKGENIGGRWIEKDTPFTIKTTPGPDLPTSAKEKGTPPKTFTDAEEQAIAGVAAKVKAATKDIRPKVDADDSISSKDKKTTKEVLDDVDAVADTLIKKPSILDTMDDNVKIPFGERAENFANHPNTARIFAIGEGIVATTGLGIGLALVPSIAGPLVLGDLLLASATSLAGGTMAGLIPTSLEIADYLKRENRDGGKWIAPLEEVLEPSFPIPQELVGTPEGEKMKKETAEAVASLKTAAKVVKKVATPEPLPPAQEEIDAAIAEDAEQTEAIIAQVAEDSPPDVKKKMLKGAKIATEALTGVNLNAKNGGDIFRTKLRDIKEAIVAEATDPQSMVAHLMGATLGTLGLLWIKPGLPRLQTFAKPKPAGKNARRLGTVAEVATFGLIDEVLLTSVVEAVAGTGFFAGAGVIFGLGLLGSFAGGVFQRLQEKGKLEKLSGEDPREIAQTKEALSAEAEKSLAKHRREIEAKVTESLKEEMLSNAKIRRRLLAESLILNPRGLKEKDRGISLEVVDELTRSLDRRNLKKYYGLDLLKIQSDVAEQVMQQILADFETMDEEAKAKAKRDADRYLRYDAPPRTRGVYPYPTRGGAARALLR